jgi:hypothetical protein
MPVRIVERLGYRMNHHQIAKAAAKMELRMVEMSNESAASLIQSVTVHNFPSARAPMARLPKGSTFLAIVFVELRPFARHAVAIF